MILFTFLISTAILFGGYALCWFFYHQLEMPIGLAIFTTLCCLFVLGAFGVAVFVVAIEIFTKVPTYIMLTVLGAVVFASVSLVTMHKYDVILSWGKNLDKKFLASKPKTRKLVSKPAMPVKRSVYELIED